MQARAKQPGGTDNILAGLVQARPHWLSLGALLLVVTALHLFSLMRTPPPYVDEGWLANRAWGLIHTGRPFGTADAGVFDRYEGYWASYPWLGTWLHAAAIRLLGPRLSSVRLVSLAFGLALLLATYAIGSRLEGPRAGLLALFLLATSRAFLWSSHLARFDVVVAALGFGAVALYVTDRSARISAKSILSGLAIGVMPDIHLTGLIYGPALLALYLLDHGWRVVRVGRFWGFAAGASAGLVGFAAVHVLPYPQTYLALAGYAAGSAATPPFLIADARVWLRSLVDLASLLSLVLDLLAALTVGALVSLLVRRSAAGKRLALLFGVLALAFVALFRHKGWAYGIMIAPAAALLLAGFLDRLWQERWKFCPPSELRTRLAFGLLAALVCAAVVIGVGRNLAVILDNPVGDYQATLARVRQAVPSGASVMGTQIHWFAFPQQTYYSWEQLVYYQRYAPGSTLEDAFRALGPEFFITDIYIEQFIVDSRGELPQSFQHLYLPRAELESFLDRHGRLVSAIRTNTFGRVRIYKIDSVEVQAE